MIERNPPVRRRIINHQSSLILLLLFSVSALAQTEFPVTPYTDPSQLDVPWPKTSHYKQPWRGYIETKSGWDFLKGIGVNYHVAGNDDLAVRLLAEAGFRTFRIEIGWGNLKWDELSFGDEERWRKVLAGCHQRGIRPTFLLNAHQGVPCPVQMFKRQLVADAPKGSKTVVLDNVGELAVGRTGLSQLSEYWAAEALITDINYETREVTLSKPLPKDLRAGPIDMAMLKYLPLHPVGTPEFEETATAWTNYALLVCKLAADAGIADFDLEIWNELTFGTRFLNINNYYDKDAPKFPGKQPDFLSAGGTCWEIARRIVEATKTLYPGVRCIWGFSNTTFHHTPVEKLPPRIDGQSYHPYGTGTRKFAGVPPRADQPPIEGFVPSYEIRMPEGFMQTFIQTECLIRHLNPLDRITKRPRGTGRFHHYMTEHGVLAQECGITDDAGAWQLKALCATRSFCLWLHKGIDVLHYFDAHEKDARSFGLLPANLPELPAEAKFEEIATPPMHAIRNLVRGFSGSVYLEKTKPLQIDVIALGEQRKVFEGDAKNPPLWHRDVIAVLPFQIDAGKHLLAVYVMTRDATKRIEPERYRLRVGGATGSRVRCYDPHEDKDVPVDLGKTSGDFLDVTLPVVDHPRLLTIGR